MSQAASLALYKADNTTNVNYLVADSTIGNTVWREDGAANLLAATHIRAMRLPVKKNSQQLRKRIGVMMPIMETATGNNSSGYTAGPRVAFPISANFDFTTTLRATEAQNKEVTTLMYRLLSNTTMITPFLWKDESIT